MIVTITTRPRTCILSDRSTLYLPRPHSNPSSALTPSSPSCLYPIPHQLLRPTHGPTIIARCSPVGTRTQGSLWNETSGQVSQTCHKGPLQGSSPRLPQQISGSLQDQEATSFATTRRSASRVVSSKPHNSSAQSCSSRRSARRS